MAVFQGIGVESSPMLLPDFFKMDDLEFKPVPDAVAKWKIVCKGADQD